MSFKKSLFLFLVLFVPLEFLVFSLARVEPPPGMALIPAGEFIMGSDEVDREGNQAELGNRKPWYLDEHPRRKLFLPDFFIDRYEATNQEYFDFVQKKKRKPPPSWKGGRYPEGQAHLPVVEVNWYEAQAFCQWRGKRLPTEAEWEKAARGPGGKVFVWGNEFDPKKGNVSAAGQGGVTMVGRWAHDRSDYGVFDLNGNAMEWTADWYQPYPGSDYQGPNFGEQFKVARGDAFGESGHYALPIFSRLAYRQDVEPLARYPFLGFRCVK
jgi:formylglycine-generating enzyme required for sulfatase activity